MDSTPTDERLLELDVLLGCICLLSEKKDYVLNGIKLRSYHIKDEEELMKDQLYLTITSSRWRLVENGLMQTNRGVLKQMTSTGETASVVL